MTYHRTERRKVLDTRMKILMKSVIEMKLMLENKCKQLWNVSMIYSCLSGVC